MEPRIERPRIGLTMGDPAGVGPELLLRALADPCVQEQARLILFGDWNVLELCARTTGLAMPEMSRISLEQLPHDVNELEESPVMVDLPRLDLDSFQPAHLSAACGQASYEFIQTAIDGALEGKLEAITTAPINKEALRLAGIHYPGHTEMFADRDPSQRWCMMQYSSEITCTFVTVHVGYQAVPQLLTTARILDTIELTAEAMLRIRRKSPKIAVCGLNPHAGEHGLFGNGEEENIIIPAIQAAQAKGLDVEGPLPPDTAFLPWKRKAVDAFVCMYHDQGHIPVKALAFDSAVNTTLGLSLIRTSVDHGTAFDIAWKGEARPHSLFSAIGLAAQLARSSH